jgi:hypothetical protein
MSIRFYLTSDAAPVSADPSSGNWDQTTGAVEQALSQTQSVGATTSKGLAESSKTNNFDVLLARFVGEPMTRPGVIQGTVTCTVAGLESSTNANDHMRVVGYVVSNDGGTVRGEFIDLIASAEWTTTAAGVQVSGTATNLTVQQFDRIVIGVGYQAQNTSSSSMTGTVYYGGQGTDLTSGDTVTTDPPWVEFAHDAVVAQFLPWDGAPAEAPTADTTAYGPTTELHGHALAAAAASTVTANAPGLRLGASAGLASVSAIAGDNTADVVNNIEPHVDAYDATVLIGGGGGPTYNPANLMPFFM